MYLLQESTGSVAAKVWLDPAMHGEPISVGGSTLPARDDRGGNPAHDAVALAFVGGIEALVRTRDRLMRSIELTQQWGVNVVNELAAKVERSSALEMVVTQAPHYYFEQWGERYSVMLGGAYNQWATCRPDWGETAKQSAVRRLRESANTGRQAVTGWQEAIQAIRGILDGVASEWPRLKGMSDRARLAMTQPSVQRPNQTPRVGIGNGGELYRTDRTMPYNMNHVYDDEVW